MLKCKKIIVTLLIFTGVVAIVILAGSNPNINYNSDISEFAQNWKIDLPLDAEMLYQLNTPHDLSNDTFSYNVYSVKNSGTFFDNYSYNEVDLFEKDFTNEIISMGMFDNINKEYYPSFKKQSVFKYFKGDFKKLFIVFDSEISQLYILETIY